MANWVGTVGFMRMRKQPTVCWCLLYPWFFRGVVPVIRFRLPRQVGLQAKTTETGVRADQDQEQGLVLIIIRW